MKILFCGESFTSGFDALRRALPDDEIMNCPQNRVVDLGIDTDVLVPQMHRLEPELIQGTKARMIHQWGVGLEGVDIPAASARGIMVCNVPGDATANAESTAEHAVFLMLGAARRIHDCLSAFERGEWGGPMGEGLHGNRALIFGLGRVGRALARKLKGMGMVVDAIRRSPATEDQTELGLDRIGAPSDLHRMAAEADFVVSTATLTDETRGIFSQDLFRVMKPTAFVVNVSRGPVVNQEDLLDALRNGTIAGAGLDVFTTEPLKPDHPFLAMANVFATPHVAGVTRQNVEGVARVVANNINRLRAGEAPLFCVNFRDVFPGGNVNERIGA
ncbi:MAG: 2-hydroxyacid dehydrogenase [Desulfomonile sp.]|nr:2-hydroxyacid dehydrogenase [Desulfomonile sp.]